MNKHLLELSLFKKCSYQITNDEEFNMPRFRVVEVINDELIEKHTIRKVFSQKEPEAFWSKCAKIKLDKVIEEASNI